MIFLLASFLCSWIGISMIAVIYLILSKPNSFLLDINPVYFRLPLPNIDDNIYTRNKRIVDLETINPDQISCPKSIAIDGNNKIYTGTIDGNVVCLDSNYEQSVIANFPLGRPLGMRISSTNKLYFIEGNSGLYSFDLTNQTLSQLVDLKRTKSINGRPSKFLDDLVVVEEGLDVYIYITDVSQKFDIELWCYTYLEPDSTGRILRYDVKNDTIGIVLENLCFPNGIEVTKEQDALLICELTKRRILKHYIKGPKIHSTEVLIDNLPGEPENIRRSLNETQETYWIGLALTRNYQNDVSFIDEYATEPILRKLILRSCYILGSIMHYFGRIFNYNILKEKGLNLKNGLALILDDFMNFPGIALEVDNIGNVLMTLQIRDNNSVISEIREVQSNQNRLLYVGSSGGKLGKIALNQ